MTDQTTYWHLYTPWFGEEVVAQIEQSLDDVWIPSAGKQIHLTVLCADPAEKARGTIIFSHGIAGYGRLVTPFGIRLRDLGYNLVIPDLVGYGFNKGQRGDWAWDEMVENLCDALDYGRQRFGGPLFLAGASMGGALAYHAACRRTDLSAVACYCLFDYRNPSFLNEVSQFKALTPAAKWFTSFSAKLLPLFSLPVEWVVSYRYVAEDPKFVDLLRSDACAGTRISLRAVSSMFDAVPAVEFEQFQTPTIVLQPDKDGMFPPHWSRFYFERLGCEKQYVEIANCGHWTLYPHQLDFTVEAISSWFSRWAN